MEFIADLHIHSHHSIATSKQLCPEYLDFWARVKGIRVVGTGDFTHPSWIKELREKLEPAEPGLFKLRSEYKVVQEDWSINESEENSVRFLLTAEISNIYKKKGRVRKVHNLIFAPGFEVVEDIQQSLQRLKFNITSDGRPILGLDSRDLLELALEASEDIFFVPAHIWTPWFSALGAKSGFDSISECYQDLSNHIHAVETGLSSDPAMNWMCSFLDPYTIISNSDAHSPEKLGREASILDTQLSYPAIIKAFREGDPEKFLGTIEFYPQEGKYHYDGHRKCEICWNPIETLKNNGLCKSCGKPVTVGVMSRVAQLSDRSDLEERRIRSPFFSLVPLKEILSEIYRVGPNTKTVNQHYKKIVTKIGSEFGVLLHASINDLEQAGGPLLAEAVRRVRTREISVKEGYDGEYGTMHAFSPRELSSIASRNSLFQTNLSSQKPQKVTSFDIEKVAKQPLIRFDLEKYRKLASSLMSKSESFNSNFESSNESKELETKRSGSLQPLFSNLEPKTLKSLNPAQWKAAVHLEGPALVIAGPGTGKTRVLTQRICHLVREASVSPENILALTFTNKAALEMKQRIFSALGDSGTSNSPHIATFHGLGYLILSENTEKLDRTPDFTIADQDDRRFILREVFGLEPAKVKETDHKLSKIKQLLNGEDVASKEPAVLYYNDYLKRNNLFDLDDLIFETLGLLKSDNDLLQEVRSRFEWILVDEFQDINLIQYSLMRQIADKEDSNFFVIGDPDQSIYGFRGSDIRFIEDFLKDYPTTSVYTLDRSYRCTDTILRASEDVLNKNRDSFTCLSGQDSGVLIKIINQKTEKSEAEFVAREIERKIGGLRFFSIDSLVSEGRGASGIESLGDFAVLCRVSKQMKVLENAFQNHGIPYQRVGERPFFKREPASLVLDVLRYLNQPESEFLARRLILTGKQIPDCRRLNIPEQIERIVDNFLGPECCDEETKRRLRETAKPFGNDLDTFLRMTALGTSSDDYEIKAEAVSLMTLHASKGLEFQCVFIVGCEEGLLPYSLFEDQIADPEEKRLLYVGMTRAKKFLTLTHCEKRFLMGQTYTPVRSRFIETIEENLADFSVAEFHKKTVKPDPQMKLF